MNNKRNTRSYHRWKPEDDEALDEIMEQLKGYQEHLKSQGYSDHSRQYWQTVAGMLTTARGFFISGRAVAQRVAGKRRLAEEAESSHPFTTPSNGSPVDEGSALVTHAQIKALGEAVNLVLEIMKKVARNQMVTEGKVTQLLREFGLSQKEESDEQRL